MEEKEKTTKRMSVTFNSRALEQLKEESLKLRALGYSTSLADLIRLAVREYLDRCDAR